MSKLDRYLDAATRASTRRSYEGAIRHFEVEAGRLLPATADQVAHYLAEYADQLAINTLKHRLAALAQWHRDHGFVDPTRAPVVRKALKGIRVVHPRIEKRATPLQLQQLGQVADWLESAATAAQGRGDPANALRHLRDRALVLLGFWRGFRGDELIRLQVQHLQIVAGQGMTCFLPHSKGDRQNTGRTYKVPALSRWCPVTATAAWTNAAGLVEGPVFRAIDRWGTLGKTGLHANSFIELLRRLIAAAGLPEPDGYSGHSLRRGFAGWANANGWDVKSLMEYVGWRDSQSALRYLDGADPFERDLGEAGRPTSLASPILALPPPKPVEVPAVSLELTMVLTPFTSRGRGPAKARRLIEEICLAPYRGLRLDAEGSRYRLTVPGLQADALDEAMATLIDDMYRIADNHRSFLEASLHELGGQRHWD